MLKNNNNIDFADFLQDKHFYYRVNGFIYSAIKVIINKGLVADVTLVSDYLKGNKEVEAAGGKSYLTDIAKAVNMAPIAKIAKLIKLYHVKREAKNIITESLESLESDSVIDIEDRISNIESKIFSLSSDSASAKLSSIGGEFSAILNKLDTVRLSQDSFVGIPTNLKDFDNLIGGMRNSDLIILAARPSMGKTALSVTMAYNIASRFSREQEGQGGVAFFSLEMSSEQLASRVASMHLKIDGIKVDTGVFHDGYKRSENGQHSSKVGDDEFQDIQRSVQDVQDMPFYIDDTPALTVSQVASRLRIAKKRHNISIAFIDYLQLLRGSSRSDGNRVQEVSEITRGLKSIAKELNIPIIALSQLSRAVEQRDDRRPQLSDLRESGSIEQDADIVLFLFREAYYLKREEPEHPGVMPDDDSMIAWQKKKQKYDTWKQRCEEIGNLAELIVGKNRNGPIGKVSLSFDANTTQFTNRESHEYEQVFVKRDSSAAARDKDEQNQLNQMMSDPNYPF